MNNTVKNAIAYNVFDNVAWTFKDFFMTKWKEIKEEKKFIENVEYLKMFLSFMKTDIVVLRSFEINTVYDFITDIWMKEHFKEIISKEVIELQTSWKEYTSNIICYDTNLTDEELKEKVNSIKEHIFNNKKENSWFYKFNEQWEKELSCHIFLFDNLWRTAKFIRELIEAYKLKLKSSWIKQREEFDDILDILENIWF